MSGPPSMSQGWRDIPGWCTKEEADYLYRLACDLPKRSLFVEIGTYLGRPAVAIAMGCIESNSRLITVDNYQGNPGHKRKPTVPEVMETLKRMKVDSVVRVVNHDSVQYASALKDYPNAVFFDGAHSYQSVLADFTAWWPRISSRGHILFHDSYSTGWKQVVRAVDDITERWPMDLVSITDSIRHYRKQV
jgi:predicted O-methyltransferase YrrM